jgi:hypothetical protein
LTKSWKVSGWKLDRAERDALLARFAPTYEKAIADHVTLKAGEGEHKVPADTQGEIVGRADDGKGVEAMVVRIGGTADRPGGGTYHITWSLAEGRKAKESNDVIAARGWTKLDEPVPVKLEGAMF